MNLVFKMYSPVMRPILGAADLWLQARAPSFKRKLGLTSLFYKADLPGMYGRITRLVDISDIGAGKEGVKHRS
ncbi:MAG: hypothetical protein CL472_00055 [Acidobacteria bacterium]|nr:hypothetical protein [Acidobacteriota bacterium]